MLQPFTLALVAAAPSPAVQIEFQPSTCVPTTAQISFQGRLTTGDLDGDGFDDVLINSNGRVQWYRGSATGLPPIPEQLFNPGSFGGAVTITPPSAPGGPAAYIAILPPSAAPQEIRIDRIEVGPSGNLLATTLVSDLPGWLAEIRVGDWGGDGIIDLVVLTNDAVNRVHVFEGNAAGTYDPPFSLGNGGTSQPLYRPILADVDDDGDLDILGGSTGVANPEIILLENRGAAGLVLQPLGGLNGLHTVRWADLDGDGVEDIVFWAHEWGFQGDVGWIKRSPGGSLGPVLSLQSGQSPLPYVNCTDFIVADFDGDGRVDWAQTQSNNDVFFNGHLTVALNRGGGAFQRSEFTGPSGFSYMGDPQLFDIDLDGDLDLLGVNTCDSINGGPFNCAINQGPPTIGDTFCAQPTPNGSGQVGALQAVGSATVAINSLSLRASSLPAGEFGFLLASRSRQALFPFAASVGQLCVGGTMPIARFARPGEILGSGPTGAFQVPVDLTDLPFPLVTAGIQPGDTVYFQVWHRDGTTTPASGLTGAVAITFQ